MPAAAHMVHARPDDIFPGLLRLGQRLATRSIQEYHNDACLYLRFVHGDPTRALAPETLRQWREAMVQETTLSPRTINRRVGTIKSLTKASAACGGLSAAVAAEFQLVERVRIAPLRHRLKSTTRTLLTPKQVRALCLQPDATTVHGLRDRAFLFTLASSGIRVNEARTLRREDMIARGQAWGLHIWGKHQERKRYAPLTQEAYAWLRRWIEVRGRALESPWVFTALSARGTLQDRLMSTNGAWMVVKRAGRAIGLESLSPHHLRKFVGTTIGERDGVRAAQQVLGHKLLQTTIEHYLLEDFAPTITEGLFEPRSPCANRAKNQRPLIFPLPCWRVWSASGQRKQSGNAAPLRPERIAVFRHGSAPGELAYFESTTRRWGKWPAGGGGGDRAQGGWGGTALPGRR